MIRFPMPLSMGKFLRTNPFTFEAEHLHPFLDIGSSYSDIKPEIRSWMIKNFGKCDFRMDGEEYCLFFENEKDISVFLLRWS